MAIETIDWIDPPQGLDGDDGTTYVLGTAFEVTETTPCPGLQWYVPNPTTPAPSSVDGVFWASLWEGTTRVKNVAFTPVAGTVQTIAFDAPYGCAPGQEYTAQVLTRRYSYATGGGYPYVSPSGVATATGGRLSTSADPTTRAAGASSARFYVSPLLGEEDAGPPAVTGTLDALLPALDAEIAGEAAIGATLAITLPSLDSALSGNVAGDVVAVDMTLRNVMREIATVLRTVTPRFAQVHDSPPGSLSLPAAVVTYPEEWTVETYGPPSVRRYQRIGVVVLAAGVNAKPKTALADLSAWAEAVPAALRARVWSSCDVVTLTSAETTVVTAGSADYLGIAFYLDAWGYGS